VIVLGLLSHGERARHRDLDGPAGVGPQEGHVGHLDRVAAANRAGHPGHRIRVAAPVQRGARVVDVHTVQGGREPVGVAFPPHLAVGHDVQASAFLRPDGQFGGIRLRLLEVGGCDTPQLGRPDPGRETPLEPFAIDQPFRLRITADQGCGEEHGCHNVRFASSPQPSQERQLVSRGAAPSAWLATAPVRLAPARVATTWLAMAPVRVAPAPHGHHLAGGVPVRRQPPCGEYQAGGGPGVVGG
jgi:hypothetical protein